jgi:hypothetical protein
MFKISKLVPIVVSSQYDNLPEKLLDTATEEELAIQIPKKQIYQKFKFFENKADSYRMVKEMINQHLCYDQINNKLDVMLDGIFKGLPEKNKFLFLTENFDELVSLFELSEEDLYELIQSSVNNDAKGRLKDVIHELSKPLKAITKGLDHIAEIKKTHKKIDEFNKR